MIIKYFFLIFCLLTAGEYEVTLLLKKLKKKIDIKIWLKKKLVNCLNYRNFEKNWGQWLYLKITISTKSLMSIPFKVESWQALFYIWGIARYSVQFTATTLKKLLLHFLLDPHPWAPNYRNGPNFPMVLVVSSGFLLFT